MECDLNLFKKHFDDENIETITSINELEEEKLILDELISQEMFFINKHLSYSLRLYRNIDDNGIKSESLDPWNVFYCLLPLTLLNYPQDKLQEIKANCSNYLMKRQLPNGGFSGFQLDNLNLVTMYGTLNGILLINDDSLFSSIDRKKLYENILSLKNEDGSFNVALCEESDIRSTFSALIICYYFNMLTDAITKNVLEYTLNCLNYDGGFSPKPHCESHGGYTFCGICILKLLNKMNEINLNKTIKWLSQRQMEFAGGYNGRTNKLVDSCYTWWVGAPSRIICDYLNIKEFWDQSALTQYLLKVTQNIVNGGFCDHPPSKPDHYHTCYSLAGLSIAGEREKFNLPIVDPYTGVPIELCQKMIEYYKKQPDILTI